MVTTFAASVEVFAPGRVNLIGEHTDYNGGLVLPFGISLGLDIKVTVRPHAADASLGAPALTCHSTFDDLTHVLPASALARLVEACGAEPLTSEPVPLPECAQGNTLAYASGALALFLAQGRFAARPLAEAILTGRTQVRVEIASTLPAGGGLSSSAALCTGLLTAWQALFGGTLAARDLARTAMHVEHRFAGARVGLMDQLAVTFARAGHFLSIDFLRFPVSNGFEIEMVKAHERFDDYVPVAFHTGVAHALAGGEYNKRRAECEQALAILGDELGESGAAAPSSLSRFSLEDGFRRLFSRDASDVAAGTFTQKDGEKVLGALIAKSTGGHDTALLARRAGHVIFENLRVRAATAALKSGNVATLSRLMRESHDSLRYSYEVSCRELDAAVTLVPAEVERIARARTQNGGEGSAVGAFRPGLLSTLGIIGARMTGGGFGGSTIQLVHASLVEELVSTFTSESNPYTELTGAKPRLVVSRPADGIRLSYL